jgi:hypothetical protein
MTAIHQTTGVSRAYRRIVTCHLPLIHALFGAYLILR